MKLKLPLMEETATLHEPARPGGNCIATSHRDVGNCFHI